MAVLLWNVHGIFPCYQDSLYLIAFLKTEFQAHLKERPDFIVLCKEDLWQGNCKDDDIMNYAMISCFIAPMFLM